MKPSSLTQPLVNDVERLVEKIRPILVHQNPQVQSAVLADLLATWLAGFVVQGDLKKTRDLRAELLRRHIELVVELTEVSAWMLGTQDELKL